MIVVLTAVLLKAVADMIVAYAGQAEEIGYATSPARVESGGTDPSPKS